MAMAINTTTIPTSHFTRLQSPAITLTTATLLNTPPRNYLNAPPPAVRAIRHRLSPRSNNPTAEASTSVSVELEPAENVVRKFYGGINRRDLAAVEELISVDCVYEDLVFARPFVGRQAIIDFFNQFVDSISSDLQFVIDDISEEDSSAVGVTWHLEWKGKPFPFSKGCSFYRLDVNNGRRQIVYGRDCVEPAIKPGESALAVIRGVTWLLEKFPSLADRL